MYSLIHNPISTEAVFPSLRNNVINSSFTVGSIDISIFAVFILPAGLPQLFFFIIRH